MKPDHKVIVIAGLLFGCAVGGYLLGPRRAGATAAGGSGTAFVGGPSVDRRSTHRTGRAAPIHAATRPMGSRVSPQVQQVLPGVGAGVADWRNFAPDAFTVQLTPDLVLPFRVAEVQREHGRTVLTARLDKAGADPSGLDGAFLVSTANTSDRWEAVIVLPGEEYRIHVDQGHASVEGVLADGWSCGSDTQAGAAGSARVLAMQAPLSGQDAGGILVPAAAAGGSPDAVDVLFLYNPDALAAKHGDLAVIDADCSNFIAASNAILENSQITNFRWHYLVAVAAPAYPTTTTLQDDLNQMTNGSISAFIAREQSAYGADQVVMLVGGWRNDAAGVAWIGGDPNRVAVVYPCLTVDHTPASTATSVIVVCHEMGHNFGCRHDRTTVGARDGDGLYCYGFRFADNSGAYPVADQGTVMSYAGSRIPYFSNPDLVYHGYALGAPIGDPKAAFNAETMADNAERIAATNAAKLEPAITGQPQSATVTPGQQLSLSVTATGSSLTYRWFKDGVALSGATNPTYTVSSAALSDAGSYTVTASNELGSATSQPAIVTVSAAGASVGGTASAAVMTGGGSSGGGAFDGCSALFLLVLLALSRLRGRGGPRF
jgi:hypothetical protein